MFVVFQEEWNMEALKGFTSLMSLQFAMYLVSKTSDESFIKAVKIAERLFSDKRAKAATRAIIEKYAENHPVKTLVRSAFTDLSRNTRKMLIKNLIVNHYIIGNVKREEMMQKLGMKVPELFVIDPSGRCNLHCSKCYSAHNTAQDELSFEEIDRLFTEARSLHIHLITLTGGEPFINPRVCELIEKHSDIFFLIYSNGLLITEEIAERLANSGNAAVAISVEGFEEDTDRLRGKGTYEGVLRTMSYLKKHGALFGFSTTVLRGKVDLVASDEFVDFYITQGCKFGWYFQYVPIGRNPNVDIMPKPEERLKLYRHVRRIRNSKPIFLGDFWGDGVFTGGCLAGANPYMHIMYNGDVKPCVFAPFAVDNIKGKSILDVANSNFFGAIRRANPYCSNKNLLMPCMIIDHPHVFRGIAKKYGAKPVIDGAETIIEDKKIVEFLDEYSRRLKEIMDPVWEAEYLDNPKSRWYRHGESYKNLGKNGEYDGKPAEEMKKGAASEPRRRKKALPAVTSSEEIRR
jgi:MoaA/NifB/PqqE/SkfB family radical SAM enzyme